jgi:hypothetical protein
MPWVTKWDVMGCILFAVAIVGNKAVEIASDFLEDFLTTYFYISADISGEIAIALFFPYIFLCVNIVYAAYKIIYMEERHQTQDEPSAFNKVERREFE